MNSKELYRAGRLSEAIGAATAEVKQHPSDLERRSFLGELLCVAGDLDRADAQFEAIGKMHSAVGPALGLIRQLIRAEKARQEVHFEGRLPEFLGGPEAHQQHCLRALVALRANDDSEAARELEAAESARPALAGTCDGRKFEELRDLDDVLAGSIEVLTSTGRCLWIPFGRVQSLELDQPTQPLDLLWRPASLSVSEGPDGKVFLPMIYADRGEALDDAARLGRRTDWIQAGASQAMRGRGLRTWLVGEEGRTLLEIQRLELDEKAA